MSPSAPRRVPAWPSYALVLLVGACAVFAFSPRKPAVFKPTAIAAEGLLVNSVLRQGGLFVTAGEQGRILISPDPKGPWQEAVIKPQRGSTLTQLLAIGGQVLLASGHDGWIVRSEDGGKTWTEVAYDTEKSDPILGLAGPYADKLFAYGAFGKFMVSTDGGKTWAAQPIVETGAAAPAAADAAIPGGTADDPYGANAAAPAASAGGGSSEDPYGANAPAEAASAGGGSSEDPYGANAPADGAAPAAEADPFANFSAQSAGAIADRHFNAMVKAGDGALILVGERGLVARSTDGGNTWASMPSGYNGSFYGVLALPPTGLLAYGMRGNVYRSEDNGQTWSRSNTPNQLSLYAATSTIRRELLLVGENSVVLVSKDGGKNFKQASIGVQQRIAAAVALDNGDLLTVGEGGIQLRDPYQSAKSPTGGQP